MTRASERLDLTQSAVSRKIQRLENRVGRPLLIRDGHTLRPTRDGRSLVSDARVMVELHDRSVARLTSSEVTGTVKLSSNGEVNPAQIASLLGMFKCEHPGATVEFTLDHSGKLTEWVDSGAIDLAIFQVSPSTMRPTDIKLWTEELTWVTSVAHRFQESPVPLIDFGCHCHYNEFTHQILVDGGVDVQSVFSAASSSDVAAAVDAGIGIAAMGSGHLTDTMVRWQPPVELAPLPEVTQIIRSVPGERPEAVAALIETIQRELAPQHPTAKLA